VGDAPRAAQSRAKARNRPPKATTSHRKLPQMRGAGGGSAGEWAGVDGLAAWVRGPFCTGGRPQMPPERLAPPALFLCPGLPPRHKPLRHFLAARGPFSKSPHSPPGDCLGSPSLLRSHSPPPQAPSAPPSFCAPHAAHCNAPVPPRARAARCQVPCLYRCYFCTGIIFCRWGGCTALIYDTHCADHSEIQK
jgi:hypothetical protein